MSAYIFWNIITDILKATIRSVYTHLLCGCTNTAISIHCVTIITGSISCLGRLYSLITHYELFIDQQVARNMKISRLPVLPGEVQIIYRSSYFGRPTFYPIVQNEHAFDFFSFGLIYLMLKSLVICGLQQSQTYQYMVERMLLQVGLCDK